MTDQFVSKWYVPFEGSTIEIPTYTATTVNVNWNDGSIESFESTFDISHVYATVGEKIIYISGGTLVFDISGFDTMQPLLYDVSECGGILKLGNSGGQFKACSSLNWTATDAPIMTGVTNLNDLFNGSSRTALVGTFSTWDTSAVTSMDETFKDCCFNPEGINSWNVGAVTTMSGCFLGARNMNQTLTRWDTSSCTNFNAMFQNTAMFTNSKPSFHVADFDSWKLDTSTTSFNQVMSGVDASGFYRAERLASGRYVLVLGSDAGGSPPGGKASKVAGVGDTGMRTKLDDSKIMSVTT